MSGDVTTIRGLLRELVDKLGERDGYDGWMLGVTIASVFVTAAAVVVALVTARESSKTAEASQKVAADAAEASKRSAQVATDLLKLEQIRHAATYVSLRRDSAESLLAALADYRAAAFGGFHEGIEKWQARLVTTQAAVEGAVGAVQLAAQEADVETADALAKAVNRVLALGTRSDARPSVLAVEDGLKAWHRGGSPEVAAREFTRIGDEARDAAVAREQRRARES